MMDKQVEALLVNYIDEIRSDLERRWDAWPMDIRQNEVHEVVGALLARQVSLTNGLASSPIIWNDHIAPIILRSMADVYITLAWILLDPLERSRKFIMYGLGQVKLQVEHRKAQAETQGDDPSDDPVIKALNSWADSQRYPFLTEVDIGSWSGLTTREMSEQAGCLDFYRYVYMPFSASVHSMWHHIGRFNLEICTNPLHRAHKLPTVPDLEIHPYYLNLAAKYLDKTFRFFDSKYDLHCPPSSAFTNLSRGIKELSEATKEP
jgi:hypothetical protein